MYEYQTYVDNIVAWCNGANAACRVVDVPAELRSYLQPGYIDGLAPKVELFDENNIPCSLPDSNCIMVFERI